MACRHAGGRVAGESACRVIAEAKARFEFRAWARSFPEVETRLRYASSHPEVRESEDLYILACGNDDSNIKIRNNALDIKMLIETRLGLEQWQPQAKYPFPVSAVAIAQDVFPALGVRAPNLQRSEYSAEQLLDEVVRPTQDLVAANVSKQRRSFAVEDCMAELADVIVDGVRFQTAAVEGERPSVVLEVKHTLGLDAFENVSYVRWIKHVIGMRPPA